MSKRWLQQHKRDPYYKRAKSEHYRSRASYKLVQINKKHRILRAGDAVLDLGAAPGGWSQVAVELTSPGGFVLGVDLQRIDPLDGAQFIVGDITVEGVRRRMLEELDDFTARSEFDAIISDISPKITGNYSMDHANSIFLCENVLDIAGWMLKRKGNMVMKVFEGDLFQDLVERAKLDFASVRLFSPPASRDSSSEIYMIAKGFRRPSDG